MQEYTQCIAEYTRGIEWYLQEKATSSIRKEDEEQIKNIYNNRSLVHYRMGNYQEAAEDAKNALALDGCHEKSMHRRALSLVMHVHDTIWTSECLSMNTLGDDSTSNVCEAQELLLNLQQGNLDTMNGDVVTFMIQANILGDFDTYEQDENIERLVEALRADVDGDDEVDVCHSLEELIEAVSQGGVSSSLTLLRATQGFRLLWFFMNDACAGQICRLIEAAHVSCILWPKDVWGYLLDHACACKGSNEFSSQCMGVLLQIIKMNEWVKLHLFTRIWSDNGSLIQIIITTIGSCHLAMNCIGKDAVSLGCDIVSCYAKTVSTGSNGISKASKGFNTIMELLNVFENAEEIVKNSRHHEEVKDNGTLQELEAKAREELIKKRDAVYNPDVVWLRRRVLVCIRKLCDDEQFVAAEFIEWKDGKKCASQLHHRLISLGKTLVENCPKCSTKVLDMHLNLVSYEKKPYAADFMDNPTGDFLATMDLDNPANIMKSANSIQPTNLVKNDEVSRPIIEMFLDVICTLTGSHLGSSLLFKAGILQICQSLTEFESCSTVDIAQNICTKILLMCKDSRKALLQSSNITLLAGVLKYAGDAALQSFAIDEMCCLIPSCQGNDFVRLIDDEDGIMKLLNEQVISKKTISPHSMRLVEQLAKRTIESGRYTVLPTGNKFPKGHAWRMFDKEVLENILYRKHCIVDSSASPDDFDVKCFSKGFLRATSLTKTPDQQDSKPVKSQTSVTDKESKGKNAAEEEPIEPTVTEVPDIDDDDGGIQVTEVYDSTPAEHIRASRVIWLALGEKERTRWEQTSTDLSVSVKVPQGTTTKEISVEVLSSSITVRLKWYGKILHGELFSRVKAKECTWCLLDDEIQLVLPKDSNEHWWKTLIKGWEEKGYYDILKDAVEADEPHVSYDDMDDSAKDLLDSMLERQAYINAGMLDLENGFDDFRIVLSDSSLQGGGASSSQS